MTTHYCQHCNEPAAHVCGDCRAAHYCGAQCKNDDWVEAHRYECRAALATGAPFDDVPRRPRERQRFPELEKRAEQVRGEHQRLTGEIAQLADQLRAERLRQSEVARAMTDEQKTATQVAMRDLFPSHREARAQRRRDFLQELSDVVDAASAIPLANGEARVAQIDAETRTHVALLFRMQDLLHARQTLALMQPGEASTSAWMQYAEEVKREQEAVVHRALFHREQLARDDVVQFRERQLLKAMGSEMTRTLWSHICREVAGVLADAQAQRSASSSRGFAGLGVKPGDEAVDDKEAAYKRFLNEFLRLAQSGWQGATHYPREAYNHLMQLFLRIAGTIRALAGDDTVRQANTAALRLQVGDELGDALDALVAAANENLERENEVATERRAIYDEALRSAGVNRADWSNSAVTQSLLVLVGLLLFGFLVLGFTSQMFGGFDMTQLNQQHTGLSRRLDDYRLRQAASGQSFDTTDENLNSALRSYQSVAINNFTALAPHSMALNETNARTLVQFQIDELVRNSHAEEARWRNQSIDPMDIRIARTVVDVTLYWCDRMRTALATWNTDELTRCITKLQGELIEGRDTLNKVAPRLLVSMDHLKEGAVYILAVIKATIGDNVQNVQTFIAQSGAALQAQAERLVDMHKLAATIQFDAPFFAGVARRLGAEHLLDPQAAQPLVESWMGTAWRVATDPARVLFAFGASVEHRLWVLVSAMSVAYTTPTAWYDVATAVFGVAGHASTMAFYALCGIIITRNMMQLRWRFLSGLAGVGGYLTQDYFGLSAQLWKLVELCVPSSGYESINTDAVMQRRVNDMRKVPRDPNEYVRLLTEMREDSSSPMSLVTFGRACDMLARGLQSTTDISPALAWNHAWRPLRSKMGGRGLYKMTALTGSLALINHVVALGPSSGYLGAALKMMWGTLGTTSVFDAITTGNAWAVFDRASKLISLADKAAPFLRRPLRFLVGCGATVMGQMLRYQMTTFVALGAVHWIVNNPMPLAEYGYADWFQSLTSFNASAFASTGNNTLVAYERMQLLSVQAQTGDLDLEAKGLNLELGARLFQQVYTSATAIFNSITIGVQNGPVYEKLQANLQQYCNEAGAWFQGYCLPPTL